MVKGNQPSLLNAIEGTLISHHDAEGVDRQSHAEKSHVRIVGQVASVLPAKGTVDLTDWPKCKTIGRIDSIRVVGGKESDFERRYYISSRDLSVDQLAAAVRAHWGIENRLHLVLDVSSFCEDGKTVCKDNAPQNLSLLRKTVLNQIRLDKTDTKKVSLRRRRKSAAWDDDMRMNTLGLPPIMMVECGGPDPTPGGCLLKREKCELLKSARDRLIYVFLIESFHLYTLRYIQFWR